MYIHRQITVLASNTTYKSPLLFILLDACIIDHLQVMISLSLLEHILHRFVSVISI